VYHYEASRLSLVAENENNGFYHCEIIRFSLADGNLKIASMPKCIDLSTDPGLMLYLITCTSS
jgi:hypothetical protein